MMGRPPDYVLVIFGVFAIGCVVWISQQFPGAGGGMLSPSLQKLVQENVSEDLDGGGKDEMGIAEQGLESEEWEGLGEGSGKSEEAVTEGGEIKRVDAALIWLHGLGDSPAGGYIRAFKQQMTKGGGLEHVKWITPAAPSQTLTANQGRTMPSWFDIPELPQTDSSPPSPHRDVEAAVKTVHALIDTCRSEGINSSRVLLGGFSQGGATALVSALTYPETLAGGAVLWGWIPLQKKFFAARMSKAGKKTPIVWSHGREDRLVEYENAEKGCAYLKQKGVQCELHGHENMKHHPHPAEFELMRSWIRERLPPSS